MKLDPLKRQLPDGAVIKKISNITNEIIYQKENGDYAKAPFSVDINVAEESILDEQEVEEEL